MVRLIDLEPHFVRYVDGGRSLPHVSTLQEADGLWLSCPCGSGHVIICWRRDRVPDGAFPGPGRWVMTGTGFSDLTLQPSVDLKPPGCAWHGHIIDGEVRPC